MRFFDRYASLCAERGYAPSSKAMAQAIGVDKSAITAWKNRGTTPNGDTVMTIANFFGVSSDYLLGRTNDPTDYTNPELVAELSGPVMDHFDGDVEKTAAFQAAVDADARDERQPEILRLYEKLDEVDRIKIEGIIQGMLLAEKYSR